MLSQARSGTQDCARYYLKLSFSKIDSYNVYACVKSKMVLIAPMLSMIFNLLLHFRTKIFCQGFNVDKKELESCGEPGLHVMVLPRAIFSVWRALAFCFWSSITSSKFTSSAGTLCLHTDPKILRSLSRHTLLEYFIQLHCCNRFLATESWAFYMCNCSSL